MGRKSHFPGTISRSILFFPNRYRRTDRSAGNHRRIQGPGSRQNSIYYNDFLGNFARWQSRIKLIEKIRYRGYAKTLSEKTFRCCIIIGFIQTVIE